MTEAASPLRPGDHAPDFALPAVTREGSISLAEYRGRSPVLLALFRGLYWPFCRRHVVSLGSTAEKLRAVGVETVGVVATAPDRARKYFDYRKPRYLVAADPDLASHRAYGVPSTALTEEIFKVFAAKADGLARETGLSAPPGGGREALEREDRIAPNEFASDMERHQAQLTGQFLIDRQGVIRWSNIETERDGIEGFGRVPSDDELLAAVKVL